MKKNKNSYEFRTKNLVLKIVNEDCNYEILLDKKFYNIIKKHQWHINPVKNGRYLYARNSKDVTLNEIIFGKKENKKVKFLNGDTLDYREENLIFIDKNSICIQLYNKRNKSSKVGVCFDKDNYSWIAQITIEKERIRKSYPIKTYGEEAKQLAIDTRKVWEEAKIKSIKENISFEESLRRTKQLEVA